MSPTGVVLVVTGVACSQVTVALTDCLACKVTQETLDHLEVDLLVEGASQDGLADLVSERLHHCQNYDMVGGQK